MKTKTHNHRRRAAKFSAKKTGNVPANTDFDAAGDALDAGALVALLGEMSDQGVDLDSADDGDLDI